MKFQFVFLLGSLMFFNSIFGDGSPLKADEDVWFFPSSASMSSDGSWLIPVHHWVFEKEENSISRKITQSFLSEIFEGLGVTEQQAHSALFRQRLMWFLVDNERNKRIEIRLADKNRKLNLTAANGHAETRIISTKNARFGEWQDFRVNDPSQRKFVGEVQFIPPVGLTVISDIDDTIKNSQVLDKKALLLKTFIEPYQVTQGMPAYFDNLKKQGAFFHYVSASPWQLYPSLKPFLEDHYPKGTITLRDFRVTDTSLIKFMQSSSDYKISAIKQIIQRYPGHEFILIGDSGEHDPEVYAEIYRRYPSKIRSIQIRAVKNSDLSKARFASTFKQVPQTVWRIFNSTAMQVVYNNAAKDRKKAQ